MMPSPSRPKRSNCAGSSSPRLPAVMSTGGPSRAPGQRPDGVVHQVEVLPVMGHRLAPSRACARSRCAPRAGARGALWSAPHAAHSRSALGRLQPTPSPSTRRPWEIWSMLASCWASTTGWRSAGSRTAVPRRTRVGDPGQVGQGRHGVEPRLGHDAVAHPDRVVAGLVGPAGHGPAGLDGRPPRRLHHRATRGNEHADSHGRESTSSGSLAEACQSADAGCRCPRPARIPQLREPASNQATRDGPRRAIANAALKTLRASAVLASLARIASAFSIPQARICSRLEPRADRRPRVGPRARPDSGRRTAGCAAR